MEIEENEVDISKAPLDSTSQYLREIKNIPLLTEEEEKELLIKAKNNDIKARDRIIKANLRLVISEAKKLVSYRNDINDLIQDGNIGLIKAIEKYDPSLGTKFSTHAIWWIRQEIQRDLSNKSRTIRISSQKFYKLSKLDKTKDALSMKLQRKPTIEELAEALGLTKASLETILFFKEDVLSLNLLSGEESDLELLDYIESSDDVEKMVIEKQLIKDMQNYLLESNLPNRSKDIIIRRFGLFGKEAMNLEEIGKIYNITKERVRILILNSLQYLQKEKKALDLKSYIDEDIEGMIDIKKEKQKKDFLEFIKDCNLNLRQMQILLLQLGLFGYENLNTEEIANLLKKNKRTIENHQKNIINKIIKQEDSKTKKKVLTMMSSNNN